MELTKRRFAGVWALVNSIALVQHEQADQESWQDTPGVVALFYSHDEVLDYVAIYDRID